MFVVKRLNNMSKIRKRGIDMTREEKEDRKRIKKIKLKANNIIESEVNIYGKFCGSISFKN